MAELTVKFKTSGLSSAARSLGHSFDTRYNDYQGIRKKVLNESTSRSYLNSSGSYLQKKMDSLDNKRSKLKAFKTNVENFCDEAKRTDKRVATRVKRDAKDTYKKLGIKTGFWATTAAFFKGAGKAIWNGLKDTWGAIKKGAKNVWEAVKEWYEKNKRIILTIITVVAAIVVITALAIFAPGVLIAAGKILLFVGKALLTVGKVFVKIKMISISINLAVGGVALLLHWLGGKKNENLFHTNKYHDAAAWGKKPGTISPYEYALLSKAAYEGSDAEMSEIMARYGISKDQIRTVSSPSGFACTIIELDKDHAIVMFRGTDQLRDWTLTNIPSLTTGYNLQAEEAKALINGLGYENIQVTGHSLGGYLAIEVALSCDRVKECVTFNALVRNNAGGLFNKNAKKITQYRTGNDVASSPFLGQRVGKVITIPSPKTTWKWWNPIGFNPLQSHEIECFIHAL